MQTITKVDLDQFVDKRAKTTNTKFLSEFSKGYLWAEIDKQEQFIEELTHELKTMKNKDSFNAQYLETWIESLKIDLEIEKKLL